MIKENKMIKEISSSDVILNCRKALHLPCDEAVLDDALLAGLLRRCAGILCPCSPATLRAALVASLNYLHESDDTLADRTEDLVESLTVYGDFLELSEVATDDPNVRGTWVFAAPPSYVVRPSGSIFLIGIAPDQDALLPESVATRVCSDGYARIITPKPEEQLENVLTAQGLQRLSGEVWLKAPKDETAESLFGRFERSLTSQSDCGNVGELEILDSVEKVTYYRGRWTTPKNQTGNFVARRPQEFGAPIWCFARLDDGIPQRIIDLPQRGFRWRGCDAAWHLQMAMDHCREQPQVYRKRNTEKGVRFDFFSPLPQWFERRFLILGKPLPREKCLLSYELPLQEVENEERLLQEKLWLTRAKDQ